MGTGGRSFAGAAPPKRNLRGLRPRCLLRLAAETSKVSGPFLFLSGIHSPAHHKTVVLRKNSGSFSKAALTLHKGEKNKPDRQEGFFKAKPRQASAYCLGRRLGHRRLGRAVGRRKASVEGRLWTRDFETRNGKGFRENLVLLRHDKGFWSAIRKSRHGWMTKNHRGWVRAH